MHGLVIIIFAPSIMCQYVTTLAGNGTSSYADGPGSSAMFNYPSGVAVDTLANVYVSDTSNNRIRKVNATGYVSTFAGSGIGSYADGQDVMAQFSGLTDVKIDAFGNLYVADQNNNMIRRVNASGYVTTIAGNGAASFLDGQGTNSMFNSPAALAIDSLGNIYIADESNNVIRKINASGYVTTIAGNGTFSYLDGPSSIAMFKGPRGVEADNFGNVYVSDTSNNRIRKINASGYVSTIAGSNNVGFSDGQGASASFNSPYGLAIDTLGNLYVADYHSNRIRKVNGTGYVSTVAGTGVNSAIDGPALSATFGNPYGIDVDMFGNIYVAEKNNRKIRKISFTSNSITTGYSPTVTIASSTTISVTSTIVFPSSSASSSQSSVSISSFLTTSVSSSFTLFPKSVTSGTTKISETSISFVISETSISLASVISETSISLASVTISNLVK